MIVKLLLWYKGNDYYDPKRHPEKDLAIVVTGCDSGFGKEICLWAADAGFVVFAACLKADSLEDFGHHNNIHAVVLDVTSDKDVANSVSKVKKWLEDKSSKKKRVLHALINNAGIWTGAETDWTDLSVYQKVMDGAYRTWLWRSSMFVLTFCIVNFFGTVRCCKAFIPILQDQAIHNSHRGARIINMSSIMGFLALASTTAYASSKHAVIAFTAGLRMELMGFDIQVSAANPSFHATGLVHQLGDVVTGSWRGLSTQSRDKYGNGTWYITCCVVWSNPLMMNCSFLSAKTGISQGLVYKNLLLGDERSGGGRGALPSAQKDLRRNDNRQRCTFFLDGARHVARRTPRVCVEHDLSVSNPGSHARVARDVLGTHCYSQLVLPHGGWLARPLRVYYKNYW